MAKVSVIVPVFNVGNYLRECIVSLVEQTLENIEIILVNDGSTDTSGLICKEFEAAYDKITVINQPNRGVSGARNTGFNAASGEYIGYVDGDDYVDRSMYERLLRLAVENHAEIVKCGHTRFFDNGSSEYNRKASKLGNCILKGGEDSVIRYYNDNINVTVWDGLYHRRIVKRVGFPEGQIHEDELFTPKALYYANKVVLTDTIFYRHRIRKGSIMTTFTLNRLDGVRSCCDIDTFLLSEGKGNLGRQLRDKKKVQNINSYIRKAALVFDWSNYRKAVEGLYSLVSRSELWNLIWTRHISKKNRLQLAVFLVHPWFVYFLEHQLKIPVFNPKTKSIFKSFQNEQD